MPPQPFETLLADLRAPLERDPAAGGWLEIALSYPGVHALVGYRAAHALWRAGVPLLPRVLSNAVRSLTGIDIHPGAVIGRGVFIDHGSGVVIGATAVVGDNCTLYQGVTLGGTTLDPVKRHPTLGRDVTVGSGAKVLGNITVGDGAKIGSNSVVVRDVPPGATVVGIPGRVVLRDGKPVAAAAAPQPAPAPADARPRADLPDPTAALITHLLERIAALETRLAEIERRNDVASTL